MNDIPANPEPQAARAVMMIRPAAFAANPQTAASNAFQARGPASADGHVQTSALSEFEALAQALSGAGVEVCVFDDTPLPARPDAVFADNWVSFHADGTVVLYPLLAANRRSERRPELLQRLTEDGPWRIVRVVDLAGHEAAGAYLEGNGSLALDRSNRIAYACQSARTHPTALAEFARRLGYETVTFSATDPAGLAIYHTNVMMCVGSDFAVICAESIRDPRQCASVQRRLRDTGHEIIDISLAQVATFAGNMLALESRAGEPLIAMSAAAWSSLEARQCARLERHGRIVVSPIPTIERYGGGSVRCMLADIHLPRRE
jgi:hypothetical protein